MAGIFEIKNRIGSISKIQGITYAMQIITITRLKKIMVFLKKSKEAYFDIKSTMAMLFNEYPEFYDQFVNSNSAAKKKPLLVLIFPNRGFCGNFNQEVITKAKKLCLEKDMDFDQVDKFLVGKRIPVFTKNQDYPVFMPEKDTLSNEETGKLFDQIEVLKEKYFPIYFVYAEFSSIVKHTFVTTQYYGIDQKEFDLKTEIDHRPIFIEPDKESFFEAISRMYYFLKLNQILINASCSEFSQRFMIMKNAVDNVKELIDGLTLEFNKERQRIITDGLLEIISTFKALKQARS
ncbi:MAG: FoF1 ATP synthase subunit gamma [Candidatus Margulisiibacteriota bacterium]|jgi:F-type H+-transporting ATPase subunit gamma